MAADVTGPQRSATWDEAARAVISFFERLVTDDADVPTVLAQSAALLGCDVGVVSADGDRTLSGGMPWESYPPGAPTLQLSTGEFVHLAATPDGVPVDLVLEQLGQTLRFALLRQRARCGRPEPLGVLLKQAHTPQGKDALRELQLSPHTVVRVVLVAGGQSDAASVRNQIAGRSAFVRMAARGRGWVLLARDDPILLQLDVPTGARVAVSRAVRAVEVTEAFAQARAALRFTQPSTHDHGPYTIEESAVVTSDVLGSYGMLAERLSADDIDAVDDVRLLNALVRSDGGEMLQTLDVVVSTQTLRQAARQLHLHHNSVSHRVARAEHQLGFSIAEPYGRNRLFLALLLRRLQISHDLM